MNFDEKFFFENTSKFEKKIQNFVNEKIDYLKNSFDNILDIEPKIYIKIMDKNLNEYPFYFSKIIDDDNLVYIEENIDTNIYYYGKIYYQDNILTFRYILQNDTRFNEIVENLYHGYILNNISWDGINMFYFNKMYKIKILEYIDELNILEDIDISELKLDYCNDKIDFNKTIYWNIRKNSLISKKYLARLDTIGYLYEIEKSNDIEYIVDLGQDCIEDICNYSDKIQIYSKKHDLDIISVYEIIKINCELIDKLSYSSIYNKTNLISIYNIKKFLQNNNIKVNNIFYSNENITHLNIPNYNPFIKHFKTSYIYINLEKISEKEIYYINYLNLKLNYEVRVYE